MSQTVETTEAWVDDAPTHELLTPHPEPPLIETKVSKVIHADRETVFNHFFGSEPHLRLDLHKDHVKAYHIHKETENTLEYEYVFEAYGARNWGKAVEVATRWDRIDVEVTEGPLTGQSIITLFEDADGGTKVTQINRVWPGRNDLMVKMMGGSLKSRLAALAGVHLAQHKTDIETDGQERFEDRFSKDHQAKLEQEKRNPVADLLIVTRAITLPIILLPILAGAALAAGQGVFDGLTLALALVGGGAALMGANLLNDLWDFRGGADQATRSVPGAIETGSGVFVEGKWSLRKGWTVTAALFAVALACGAAIALATPMVLAYAVAGFLISYIYVGPPFPLAYKGRGLGELAIFVAFGILPVLGAVEAFGGTITPAVWWTAALFGLTSSVVLYHHHFLHWMSDKVAGKGSPVAVLGPRNGARVGIALSLALIGTLAAAVFVSGTLPRWTLVAAAWTPLMLLRPQLAVAGGDDAPPARQKLAAAAFFTVFLTNLSLVLTLWLA